jgi:hypothetical protein
VTSGGAKSTLVESVADLTRSAVLRRHFDHTSVKKS